MQNATRPDVDSLISGGQSRKRHRNVMRAVGAVFERDYPVIMGNLVIVATLTLVANLVADIAYGLVDPRIRVGRRR